MNAQLQRGFDEDAIRRITAYYSDAVSRLDATRAASVYVEDGVVEIVGLRTAGRDAIEQGMRQSFAAFELLQLIAHGSVISVDGDTAQARWSTVELGIRRGSQTLNVIFGRYEDVLVRWGHEWRFRQRVFTMAGRTQIETAKLQLNPSFFSVPIPGLP